MYDFFTYTFSYKRTGMNQRVTVVFCPHPDAPEAGLIESLQTELEGILLPDQIVLLGTQGVADSLLHYLSSSRVRSSQPHVRRELDPTLLTAIYLRGDRTFVRVAANGSESSVDDRFVQQMVHSGVMTIFEKHKGILEATGAHHYVKPSGRHCNKFIRAANVLIRGAEVSFVAFSLLKLMPDGIDHIYTDTAAINLVGYALSSLWQQLYPEVKAFGVDSFSSYGKLATFKFENVRRSLFLISASTSSKLEKEILEKDETIERAQIITLFYLGPKPKKGSKILCDLSSHYSEFNSYEPDECELCRQGSTELLIAGDQFLPEGPHVDLFQLTAKHAPDWLVPFIRDVLGNDVIRCHYRPISHSQRAVDVYLELKDAFEADLSDCGKFETLRDRLNQMLTRTIPAALKRIVYIDEHNSQALAELIKRRFTEYNPDAADKVSIVSTEALDAGENSVVLEDGASMVVASTIRSGRRLASASQSLRHLQANHAIQYFVAIGRSRSKEAFDQVRSNVCYGPNGPGEFDFHWVHNLFLPDDPATRISPWEEERSFLVKLGELVQRQPRYSAAVRSRQDQLDQAQSKGGLRDDAFWKRGETENRLKLRPTFAFWPAVEYGDVTEAEVYFTLTAVLHSLREGQRQNAPLIQTEHKRVLLSPYAFDRFNDGVVQAALLRAAKPAELDYSLKGEHSETMLAVLTPILLSVNKDRGEAAVEFLLALALERLKVQKSPLSALLRRVRKLPDIPVTVAMLCDYLTDNLD